MVASGMQASPGKVLLGLVMNLLCGRSPLYRVEEFFRSRDVALLLGEDMTAGLGSNAFGTPNLNSKRASPMARE